MIVWTVLGVLCVAYFIFLIAYCGFTSNFFLVWLFFGLGCFLLRISAKKHWISTHIPLWCQRTAGVCILLGLIVFIIIEGMIFSGYKAPKETAPDYVIVLGASVKPTGPSKILRYRLDRAYTCYEENSETVFIVSGGQGSNEPMTEAESMAAYLIEKGIPKEQILQENQSVNTNQNLLFSKELIPDGKSVGVVSNNFHIFRATHIAKKAGYDKVYGIPAGTDLWTQPNNLLREFCGVMKDFLMQNM